MVRGPVALLCSRLAAATHPAELVDIADTRATCACTSADSSVVTLRTGVCSAVCMQIDIEGVRAFGYRQLYVDIATEAKCALGEKVFFNAACGNRPHGHVINLHKLHP